MADNTNHKSQTPAFGIGLFISAIIFIIILNHLPFPRDYEFINLAGVFIASAIVAGIIYAFSVGLVSSIYKIIVELAAVILLLFNATYAAYSWASFDAIKASLAEEGMFLDMNENVAAVLVMLIILLVIDLLAVFILYPLAQIAGTTLEPE